ncbi:hypothetical protein P9112_005640 [Eukaryota sp. TZLM1-RC]
MTTVLRHRNPTSAVDPIVSQRILQHSYWKEHCYGLNEAGVVQKATTLDYIGGSYSIYLKPTPFLCLLYKLLQLAPSSDIVLPLIQQNKFKYITALGMMYIRSAFKPQYVYPLLDQFYSDFRKLRVRFSYGWDIMHIDELSHALLTSNRLFDVSLPYLPSRSNLGLPPRRTPLLEVMSQEDVQKEVESTVVIETSTMETTLQAEGTEIEKENALRLSLGLKPLEV